MMQKLSASVLIAADFLFDTSKNRRDDVAHSTVRHLTHIVQAASRHLTRLPRQQSDISPVSSRHQQHDTSPVSSKQQQHDTSPVSCKQQQHCDTSNNSDHRPRHTPTSSGNLGRRHSDHNEHKDSQVLKALSRGCCWGSGKQSSAEQGLLLLEQRETKQR